MRKEVIYKVEDEASRDNGKEFLITEMTAWDIDTMSQDLFRIMGECGFSGIEPDVIAMGCAGLATVGLSVITAASPEAARQVRDRLMATVEIVIENDGKTIKRKVNGPLDFEEAKTIRVILDKCCELNFSFLAKGSE